MAKKELARSASLRISEPCLVKSESGWAHYTVTATLDDGSTHSVVFEVADNASLAPSPSIRTSLLTFLLPAMRIGATLIVDAPVDALTYQNLMEYQTAFAAWQPDRLTRVPIDAQVVAAPARTPAPPRPLALTSFSGGVDSCHTLWLHSARAPARPWRQAEVRAGLMVHGLDIPFEQVDTFASAFARSAAILQSHDANALAIRTDIRQMGSEFGLAWGPISHGAFLAACLSFYESSFDVVLIPSTYAYEVLKFPWGSNPVTDPLLGGATPYWHDGAAFLKLHKVRDIANDAAMQQHLRVCWEGEHGDRNCGHCFKCVATQACFWSMGVAAPACFHEPASLDELARVTVKNEQNHYLLDKMREYATLAGRPDIAGAIVAALRAEQADSAKTQRRSIRNLFGFK